MTEEDVCAHCEKRIRKIQPYPNAPTGVWMHVEGTHAYEDCRGLKATPRGDADGQRTGKHHVPEVRDDQLQPE